MEICRGRNCIAASGEHGCYAYCFCNGDFKSNANGFGGSKYSVCCCATSDAAATYAVTGGLSNL